MISSGVAQIGTAPNATDVSPTIDTDTSSFIATGCGYDAWTGSARRGITDFEVPGAVSGHGLKWQRTYNASTGLWSFSYTWRLFYRPFFQNTQNAFYPDGRGSHFEVGTKERYFQGQDAQGNKWSELYLDDGEALFILIGRQRKSEMSPTNIGSITIIHGI